MEWHKFKSISIIAILFVVIFIGVIKFQDDLSIEVNAAKPIYVPSNYISIQAAIDNASSGDTIYVWAGTYYENVIVNKTVTLIGNGSEDTIIDGGGIGVVIKIIADWVNVSGFKIINSGNGPSLPPYGGIELDDVENVTIFNNNCSNNGNGINVKYSKRNNIINNSCYSNNYNGILVHFSDLNKLENNTSVGSILYYGIFLIESDSNNVNNNTCLYNRNGIKIQNSDSNHLNNNICNFNEYLGIWVLTSNSNIIENSTSNFNGVNGIQLRSSQYNIIINNTCNSNYNAGILIYLSESNTVVNNSCNSTWMVGLSIKSSKSNTLLNNKLSSSGVYIDGDKLEHWNTHTIDLSNTVEDKSIYYWKNRTGGTIPLDAGQIILANSTDVHIENQFMSNRPITITLGFSSKNTITNNTFVNNTSGIRLYSSNSNTVSNNFAKSTGNYGISLYLSSENSIFNNTFNSNDKYGIDFFNSKNNIITNNKISVNDNGIHLNFSHSNTIFNNNIFSNKKYGLIVNNSNLNIIYHNNFINNEIQAIKLGISNKNDWDNGNDEGNYWSDYDGLDNGANDRISGDGIGDTEIPHLNLDYYPFVNKSGWFHAGIPILYDPGDFSSNGTYLISWYPTRGVVEYILEEDTNSDFNTQITVFNGTETRYYITARANNTYYYRLKAIGDESESLLSNIVDIIVDWPPKTPKNLTVALYPEGNVLNITWDNIAVEVKNYELYYKSEEMDSWELLTSLYYPEHIFDHTGLTDGKNYEYKVCALDARKQSSEFSDIRSGMPKDSVAPKPPKGLKITDITHNSIKLVWEPNSEPDLMGYNIYEYSIAQPFGWGNLTGTVKPGNESYLAGDLDELTAYYYVIRAFDEVPNISNISMVVSGTTKLGPHGPEINESVQDFWMSEDSVDISKINLYRWFKDINNDPLEFWCSGDKYINVTIFQNNGSVLLKPAKDWYGFETLIFYSSDGEFDIFDDVNITVIPLNDPPKRPNILEPDDKLQIAYGTELNFSAECNDSDLPNDELTYKWISDLQGELGFGDNLVGVKLKPGEHKITLMVTDKAGINSTENMTITVIEIEPPSDQDKGDQSVMLGIISGIIIVIFLIFILSFIFMKKYRQKKEVLKGSEPTASRFSFLSLRVTDTSAKEPGAGVGVVGHQTIVQPNENSPSLPPPLQREIVPKTPQQYPPAAQVVQNQPENKSVNNTKDRT